jgi:hypothetical protein
MDTRSAESAYYSPKRPLLSEALDSTDSIRFSKFQRFELLMNHEKKGSAVSLGQPRYPMAERRVQSVASDMFRIESSLRRAAT